MQRFNEKETPKTGFGSCPDADPYLQPTRAALRDGDACSSTNAEGAATRPVNNYIDAFFANKENVPPSTKELKKSPLL